MINLIPKAEKKKIIKELLYKLVVLFLVVGTFSFFISSVVILPSYFLSSTKLNIVDAKLEAQKKETAPSLDNEVLDTIKTLDSELSLVEKFNKNRFSVSEKVINAIILKKTPGVHITNISYKNEPNSKTVTVQGDAPSREALFAFRQALESNTTFKKVDLPISNFVKGSNIKFFLNLVIE